MIDPGLVLYVLLMTGEGPEADALREHLAPELCEMSAAEREAIARTELGMPSRSSS